jgi:hypothetical protein
MITLFLRLFQRAKEIPVPLGRWGYHWEQKMKYQTYYD